MKKFIVTKNVFNTMKYQNEREEVKALSSESNADYIENRIDKFDVIDKVEYSVETQYYLSFRDQGCGMILRSRHYKDSGDTYLEYKINQQDCIQKHRWQVNDSVLIKIKEMSRVEDIISYLLSENIILPKYFLSANIVKLDSSLYNRVAWHVLFNNEKFRITLDRDVMSNDRKLDQCILELKGKNASILKGCFDNQVIEFKQFSKFDFFNGIEYDYINGCNKAWNYNKNAV